MEDEEEHGILLYYQYATIPDLDALLHFFRTNCSSLQLLGRVRIAPHGVNVTVGGKISSLQKHMAAVQSNALFEGCDFKLASCHSPKNISIAKECGFTSLSIRVVKELVTLSSHPWIESPTISNAGKHLTAVEFHSILQIAGGNYKKDGTFQGSDLISLRECGVGPRDSNLYDKFILLDARNVYETRIGKFQAPNIETLEPKIRQYSDLPTWIDNISEQLHGKCILMYCTGGIRCEMASAYIRMKGSAFENVYQLYGGIQRYLEQYPDGGFFHGKNFVFDPRISVGSSDKKIVGSCLLCGVPFDDYSSRCRCHHCRMLVLVCNICQEKGHAVYTCELCQKNGTGNLLLPFEGSVDLSPSTPDGANSVELELTNRCDPTSNVTNVAAEHNGETRFICSRLQKKLRILCLHGFRQNASNFKGRTASFAKKIKRLAELVYIDAPHEVPFVFRPRAFSDQGPPLEKCNRRFAWFISPESHALKDEAEEHEGPKWVQADEPFDPLQYEKQTEGWETSYAYIMEMVQRLGPFDGVLGFSQGAAMAATLCAKQERESEGQLSFGFVILCSGFLSPVKELFQGPPIKCPSLHIFGSERGNDRQITHAVSVELVSMFSSDTSVLLEHDSGHIIPTRQSYIDQIKAFLDEGGVP
ncbi:hypothetical protein AMTRI_Chr02g263390 [Amborella trichopoda]|uniref:Rhodanese domain-containing protein n=1 Tax=Amborella trichopoda TaxID=13333 RepID=W1P852_AMBTC|nr:rhodanese-like domain-containing protein 6 [Amborella trichopoda]ERN03155.1 hypothetical protein AMTR_s00003p00111200 [Amborella trichopoda]|eukprot:XP_006841480.1 rhodanese-like domain-containing protein 6 [Amborella trichopoda]